MNRIFQGGEDRHTSEDLESMQDEALLSMSPDSLRTAVGPERSHSPNATTSIVRRFLRVLINNVQERSGRVSGRKKDRAAKRRIKRRARRPTPTTVAVSELVSHPQCCFAALSSMTLNCTPFVRIADESSTLVENCYTANFKVKRSKVKVISHCRSTATYHIISYHVG